MCFTHLLAYSGGLTKDTVDTNFVDDRNSSSAGLSEKSMNGHVPPQRDMENTSGAASNATEGSLATLPGSKVSPSQVTQLYLEYAV